MRRKLLIGLGLYLALGVVFGLVTHRENFMCPPSRDDGHYTALPLPEDIKLVEVPRSCLPIFNAGERVRWVATTTPGWLPLVIRNVVRGEGIQIGDNIILGPILPLSGEIRNDPSATVG